MARLLVVDDEPSICWGLQKLGQRLGHDVQTASSAERAIELAGDGPLDAIVLDVRLPGMDGLSAMKHLRELSPDAPIIVITAYGDLQTAVEAVRQGAFEYIVKPFDLDKVEGVLSRALSRPKRSVDVPVHDEQVDGLIGKTPAMQEVFRRIALVAACDAGVLLQGESGTGKELVARAIHRYSQRSAGPFVAVNVASLSASLAESELFGHVRGAFTGADQARTGLLVQAHNGTLFLDEVADIPQPIQVKLLRALEHGEVTPVGSGKAIKTDFRVVSATHQDLRAMVEDGSFRHDLYYRLCTFQIDLPPLRDRREDIRRLAEHFIRQFVGESHSVATRLTAATMAELNKRPWYGNVRELRNAIEHGLILARDGPILPEQFPAPAAPPPGARTSRSLATADQLAQLVKRWAEARLAGHGEAEKLYEQLLALVEPPLFEAALRQNQNQCATAARALGIHRTTLRKKLDHYGIDGSD